MLLVLDWQAMHESPQINIDNQFFTNCIRMDNQFFTNCIRTGGDSFESPPVRIQFVKHVYSARYVSELIHSCNFGTEM